MTRVYRYFLAHTGNPHDAEDLTSQTFIAVLEGLRSFRGTGSFAAWIMGIAAKKRAGYFRSNHRETGLENESEIGGLAPAADQTISQRLQVEKNHHALRQISPDRAEASVLTFFGGLNAAEAGRVLGKSEAAVRMLISRGLRDLRTRTVLAVEVGHE